MDKLYHVLLVDDEEDIIDVMMKKIDWEDLGFRVVGTATNGIKALEIAEESQVDVVMTDIRMPYMDGLELAAKLRKEFPTMKILIFTGFDEFEYAKTAVHLEVEEYILKPANKEEMTRVYKKLKETLDEERNERQSVEKLQKYYMDSLPLLQANFYTMLIEGQIEERDLAKSLLDYQVHFEGPYYACIVIHTSQHKVPEGMSPMLLTMSVQKQARDRLEEKWRGRSFTYLGNLVMIVQLTRESDLSQLTDECDRFCKSALRILGAHVTIGIGRSGISLLDLKDSYAGAKEAVSYRALYGASQSINIQEIAPTEAPLTMEDGDIDLHELFKQIRMGTKTSIEDAAGKCIFHLQSSMTTMKLHSIAVRGILSEFYTFSMNNGIDFDEICGIEDPYRVIPQMEEDNLHRWLMGVSLALNEKMGSARNSATHSYVEKAKDYVADHYMEEDLSLDTMCAALGVSSTYFSSVFKKETGRTFISYLTDYRMEIARRLLIETQDKNYVIGKKVGYADANYFSYVFKKEYGTSPSRYRKEHIDQA